jgi:transcription initiation factor TFIIIB Brf1 subunit/transcription initiation factor TFIIB
MRTSAEGRSPEKMAIADIVITAAMAGSGSRKNANGTSRAVASVAVRPGMAPMNRP